jgi:ATP/ADP translocase
MFRAAESDRTRQLFHGILAGLTHNFCSPCLLDITLFILACTVISAFFCFQQATIAETSFPERAIRTTLSACIGFWVNALARIFQLLFTGRLTGWWSVVVVRPSSAPVLLHGERKRSGRRVEFGYTHQIA